MRLRSLDPLVGWGGATPPRPNPLEPLGSGPRRHNFWLRYCCQACRPIWLFARLTNARCFIMGALKVSCVEKCNFYPQQELGLLPPEHLRNLTLKFVHLSAFWTV